MNTDRCARFSDPTETRFQNARDTSCATRPTVTSISGPISPVPPPPTPFVLQEKCGTFSCSDMRVGMRQAIEQKLHSRIYENGIGWAFSQVDFAGLAARSRIDSALHRRGA